MCHDVVSLCVRTKTIQQEHKDVIVCYIQPYINTTETYCNAKIEILER